MKMWPIFLLHSLAQIWLSLSWISMLGGFQVVFFFLFQFHLYSRLVNECMEMVSYSMHISLFYCLTVFWYSDIGKPSGLET